MTMTSFENILLTMDQGIATLTIHRPKALNALNKATLTEIFEAIQVIKADETVQVLIITGAGEKAFVAGADIKEMADMNAMQARAFSQLGNATFKAIESLPIPTIAAINGYALGGGLELSMACDLRFASEKAVAGLPEVGLGVIPGFGGTQRMPRIIGESKAKEFLFTGENIDAQKAYDLGLFNRIFAPENLIEETMKYAQTILKKGPIAVRLAKSAVSEGMEMPLHQALAHEAELFALAFSTHDQKEGMAAFVEKRSAEFKQQ